jgi:hypothetical protein
MSQLKWPRNRLLLALPASNLKRLMSQLELVPCERGRVLLDVVIGLILSKYWPSTGATHLPPMKLS